MELGDWGMVEKEINEAESRQQSKCFEVQYNSLIFDVYKDVENRFRSKSKLESKIKLQIDDLYKNFPISVDNRTSGKSILQKHMVRDIERLYDWSNGHDNDGLSF